MIVNIRKPLYGTFVNIRKSLVLKAIKNKEILEIVIPQGSAIVSPKWWLDTGKEVEQVFKFPDNPMKMVGNYVPIKKKSEEEELKKYFM